MDIFTKDIKIVIACLTIMLESQEDPLVKAIDPSIALNPEEFNENWFETGFDFEKFRENCLL